MLVIKDNGPPIFEQIVDYFIQAIISQSVSEGEALPSIRNLSIEINVNPLTIAKAYQKMEEAGWIEKRRGQGFWVKAGAQKHLKILMTTHFLEEEWPSILRKLQLLELDLEVLLKEAKVRPQ